MFIVFSQPLAGKEPMTRNPVKLIWSVMKYARSGFTYHEDIIPSRIDFGESKFFTIEERYFLPSTGSCYILQCSDSRYLSED